MILLKTEPMNMAEISCGHSSLDHQCVPSRVRFAPGTKEEASATYTPEEKAKRSERRERKKVHLIH